MENSKGGLGAHNDFWYFERLPPAAREALANAKFSWSSAFMYNAWKHKKTGFKTGEEIAKSIAEWDAKKISRETRKRRDR
jgi:Family of unknown function (DUF6525)